MKKGLFFILSGFTFLLGIVFLYSAYTKLNPIQTFEYTLVEFLKLPWYVAAYTSRLFIGLELALGALLLFHCFGKNKWVLKLAFVLLLLFNIYLIYLLAKFGNNVNCGCFGDAIWMTPTVSLLKNVLLLVILAVIIRFHKGLQFRYSKFITPTLFFLIILLPFIFFYIPTTQPNWLRKDTYKIDFSPLYLPDNQLIPNIELGKGKHIIAFLSPFCPHCILTAYKMQLMSVKNVNLPFFMVIGGTQSSLTEFWQKTKAQNIPYTRLDKKYFLQYTGGVFPLIIWVNNGIVIAKSDYADLDQIAIEKWLSTSE